MAEEKKGSTKKQESPKRLYRSRSDQMICGVCGGFAEYIGVDSTMVRIIWTVAVLFGGIGLAAYILGWIIIPQNPNASEGGSSESKTNTSLLWGGLLIIAGLFVLMRRFDWHDILPYHIRWNWHPM